MISGGDFGCRLWKCAGDAIKLMPGAPAAMLRGDVCPLLHANLSGMLPQRPLALDGDFAVRFLTKWCGLPRRHRTAGRPSLPDLPKLLPPAHRAPLQARLHPVRLLPKLRRLLLNPRELFPSPLDLLPPTSPSVESTIYLASLAFRAASNSSPLCHSIDFVCSLASHPSTKPNLASLASPRKSQSARNSSAGW